MQVKSVQSSQNFGMSLRIKNPTETAKALRELPIDVIRSYKEAGEALKDTKFYHVEVGPDLKPQIVSKKGAFWGPVKDMVNGRKISSLSHENDNLGIGRVYGVSRLRSGEAAEDGMVHHNVWTSYDTVTDGKKAFTMESLADVATTLDAAAVDFAKKAAAQETAAAAAKLEAAEEVEGLISKFAVDA